MSQLKNNFLTPVEYYDNICVKRDDLFKVFNSRGGKARSAYYIIVNALDSNQSHFVTAGSRISPQCEIVSDICENLKLNCFLFMPQGQETTIIKNIKKNSYSTIQSTFPGYNNVIISRAINFAKENNFFYIPFGMECQEMIEINSKQVENIPKEVKRIVVPIGSGMSFLSILKGLNDFNRTDIKLIGVEVGKNCLKTINKFIDNKNNILYEIKKYNGDYHTPVKAKLHGIEFDPYYEAKCLNFLNDGDCFWIVGKRNI